MGPKLKDGSTAKHGQRVKRWSSISRRYVYGTVMTVVCPDDEQEAERTEGWKPTTQPVER
jgi:hypothetical protein